MPWSESQIPDRRIIEAYKNTLSYSLTGKEVGLSRQRIHVRINKLRSLGWDLPDPQCQVKGCPGRNYALDMCRRHHAKYMRYGHPLAEYKYVKPSADWRKKERKELERKLDNLTDPTFIERATGKQDEPTT